MTLVNRYNLGDSAISAAAGSAEYHIHVGLEDALLDTPVSTTNLGLVEDAVRIVRDHGAEPATPDDVRQTLGAISDAVWARTPRRPSPDLESP